MADAYPLSDLFKYGGGYTTSGRPDAETQYFIDKGYLTAGGTNDAGLTTYNYMGGNIPAANVGGGKTAQWGSFWQPQGISGSAQLIDPSAVAKGTNYGDITSIWNMRHPEDTDFMSKWFPAIASSLLGLGMGGAIGAVGGGGGLFGPGSLLSKVPQLGKSVGSLFGGQQQATTAQPNAGNIGSLLPILALLGLLKGGG